MKKQIVTACSFLFVLLNWPITLQAGRMTYKMVGSSVKSQLSQHTYTGQEKERELKGKGIYNFRAREYDPQLRTFLSPDRAKQQLGAYAFVFNNPVNFVDKDGRQANSAATNSANNPTQTSNGNNTKSASWSVVKTIVAPVAVVVPSLLMLGYQKFYNMPRLLTEKFKDDFRTRLDGTPFGPRTKVRVFFNKLNTSHVKFYYGASLLFFSAVLAVEGELIGDERARIIAVTTTAIAAGALNLYLGYYTGKEMFFYDPYDKASPTIHDLFEIELSRKEYKNPLPEYFDNNNISSEAVYAQKKINRYSQKKIDILKKMYNAINTNEINQSGGPDGGRRYFEKPPVVNMEMHNTLKQEHENLKQEHQILEQKYQILEQKLAVNDERVLKLEQIVLNQQQQPMFKNKSMGPLSGSGACQQKK